MFIKDMLMFIKDMLMFIKDTLMFIKEMLVDAIFFVINFPMMMHLNFLVVENLVNSMPLNLLAY